MFAELKSTVTDTKQAVVDLQNVLVKQYSQMLDSIAQLNQKSLVKFENNIMEWRS